MILVDFQSRPQFQLQPCQHVVSRHQEQGFSINFLFLKSTGLLLKSCCSEIIDDVHHSPVCRIGRPSIFHGTPGSTDGPGKPGCTVGILRLVRAGPRSPRAGLHVSRRASPGARTAALPAGGRLSNSRWRGGQRGKFLLRFSGRTGRSAWGGSS